jgi:glycosyltransferase involved in cell wall biosynthesis
MPPSGLKVCFFSGFFPSCPGGAEYQAYLLADKLRTVGHNVFFISIGGHKSGKYAQNGYPVYFLNTKWFFSKLGKSYFLLYPEILRILETEKPDFVYQRGGYAATGILAQLAKKVGYKFIWACASDRDLLRSIYWNDWRAFNHIDRLLRIYGIRRADLILTQTFDQQKALRTSFCRDGVILRNGHPITVGDMNKKGDCIKIVYIANLKLIKQPDIFVDLASRFRNIPKIEFVIIGRPGSGKWFRTLEARIRALDNLRFLGELPHNEVNEHLGSAHILVNTSQYEGFSNTFIQAWLHRVPVVSLKADPDRLLSEGGLGFCSGNFERLCSDLQRLIEDPALRESVGEKARLYAREKHSIEKTGAQFLELIESLV